MQLTNLLLVCVNEFHLTRLIRGCGPMLPPKIEGRLRDLREYLPHNEAGHPSTDVQEKDKGNLLRLACWLHCLDMAFTYSRGTAQSLRRKDHEEIGNLLHFLLAPRVGPLTSADVIDRVLQENRDDTLRKLKEAKDGLKSGQVRLPKIEEEMAEAKKGAQAHPEVTLPDPRMCNALRGSANASSEKKRRKKNTSNNAGMAWHTANIIWINSLQERLQNGQPSLWENCPINQSPLWWTHYLMLRDLHLQGAKTPPLAKM